MQFQDIYKSSWGPRLTQEKMYEESRLKLQRNIFKVCSVTATILIATISATCNPLLALTASMTGLAGPKTLEYLVESIKKLRKLYPLQETKLYYSTINQKAYKSTFKAVKTFQARAMCVHVLAIAVLGFYATAAATAALYLVTTYACYRLAYANLQNLPKPPTTEKVIDLSNKSQEEIEEVIKTIEPAGLLEPVNLNLANSDLSNNALVKLLNRLFSRSSCDGQHFINLNNAVGVTQSQIREFHETRQLMKKIPKLAIDLSGALAYDEVNHIRALCPRAKLSYKKNPPQEPTDFTLKVGNREFYVHKSLLKSCGSFLEEIRANAELHNDQVFEFNQQPFSAETFETVLNYLYTLDDKLITDSNSKALYPAFDYLGIHPLPVKLEKYIMGSLNDSNILEQTRIAFTNNYLTLQKNCKRYLVINYGFYLEFDPDKRIFNKLVVPNYTTFNPALVLPFAAEITEIHLNDVLLTPTPSFLDRLKLLISKTKNVSLSHWFEVTHDEALQFALSGATWRTLNIMHLRDLESIDDVKASIKRIFEMSDPSRLEELSIPAEALDLVPTSVVNLKKLNQPIEVGQEDSLSELILRNRSLQTVMIYTSHSPSPKLKKTLIDLLETNSNLKNLLHFGEAPEPFFFKTISSKKFEGFGFPFLSLNLETAGLLSECSDLKQIALKSLDNITADYLFKKTNIIEKIEIGLLNIKRETFEKILSLSPCLVKFQAGLNPLGLSEITKEYIAELRIRFPKIKFDMVHN